MTRTLRFVALVSVVVGLSACANPTAPSAKKCNPKQGSACTNVDYVNPNVDYVNPNV
jgi:ABC-type oligopeptide transport system substrate-binding subunit